MSAWERLAEVGERLRTEDNRITREPLFAVQQRHRIWQVDPDEADGWVWHRIDDDYRVATDEESERLDEVLGECYDLDGELEGWHQNGYVDRWDFVTACLTEAACEAYIAINGHNLTDPRIYTYSGWRNAEWTALREAFRDGPNPAELAAEVERLRAALDGLLTHYVDLVNCGDCGFWDPEKEPEVIAARTALDGNDTTSDREGET